MSITYGRVESISFNVCSNDVEMFSGISINEEFKSNINWFNDVKPKNDGGNKSGNGRCAHSKFEYLYKAELRPDPSIE
jgi:hypothetical protein